MLPVPPRRMWDWTPGRAGYCGETCFQMALALHGVYVSSETVHRATGKKELLIGVNDVKAAKALKMKHASYSCDKKVSKEESFVRFAKQHLTSGALIAVGVYTQNGDDEDYDHIVPIVGFTETKAPELDEQMAADIQFLFYDLWNDGAPRKMSATQLMTRSQVRLPPGVKTAPPGGGVTALPKKRIYAIALYGVEGAVAMPSLSVVTSYLEEPDTRGLLVASSAPIVDISLRVVSRGAAAAAPTGVAPFGVVAVHGFESARVFSDVLRREAAIASSGAEKKGGVVSLSSALRARLVIPASRVVGVEQTGDGITAGRKIKLLSHDTVIFFAVEPSLLERVSGLLITCDDSPSSLTMLAGKMIHDEAESSDDEDEEEEEEDEDEDD